MLPELKSRKSIDGLLRIPHVPAVPYNAVESA